MFCLGQWVALESSELCWWFLWEKSHFLVKEELPSETWIIIKDKKCTRKIFRQLVKILWKFLSFQYRFDSPQVKWYLISNIKNLISSLPHKRLRNLGLKILENYAVLEKSQNVTTGHNFQSSRFRTLVIGVKNYTKTGIKFFLPCLVFYWF